MRQGYPGQNGHSEDAPFLASKLLTSYLSYSANSSQPYQRAAQPYILTLQRKHALQPHELEQSHADNQAISQECMQQSSICDKNLPHNHNSAHIVASQEPILSPFHHPLHHSLYQHSPPQFSTVQLVTYTVRWQIYM